MHERTGPTATEDRNEDGRHVGGESGAIRDEGRSYSRFFLPVVVLSVFVSVLANSMVGVVMPVMAEDFGVSVAQVAWVLTGFSLVFAIGIPLWGRLSDSSSPRHLFSLGLLLFAVGGPVCALSPSLMVLVLGRVVQAAGVAAVVALAFVAVARVLPAGARGGALGLIASAAAVGTAAGPMVGGGVEQLLGWRFLFFGLLVLALLLLPAALYALPDGGAEGHRRGERSFDPAGGILLGLAAGLFLFGVTRGQVAGFDSWSSWGSFLGSALSGVGFARRITTAPHPFVSPALLKNRAYVAAVLVGFFSNLAYLSALVFVPQFIVSVNGLSAGAAGLVLTPCAGGLAVLSPLTGRLSDRVGAKVPVLAGLAVMGLSLLFISSFSVGASPVIVSAGVLGVGVGMAFVQPPTTNAATNALPGEEVGAGLGIFQGAFFLGSATGPAVLGAFLAARLEANGEAINPLYTLDAAPFSDVFLAMAVAVIFALAAAPGLGSESEDAEEGGE